MPTVTFIAYDQSRHPVTVPVGETLMRAATDYGVPGIDGDCGGQCACGTCHVYVEAPWAQMLPAIEAREEDMLNFANERQASSRLSCQIVLTSALDGLKVSMPQGQH